MRTYVSKGRAGRTLPDRQQESQRETDRQTERQTGRQADRQTGRQADRQTGRQADRQTGRQADRQADRQTGRLTGRQADRQTGRQANRQTDRGRETNMHTSYTNQATYTRHVEVVRVSLRRSLLFNYLLAYIRTDSLSSSRCVCIYLRPIRS